MRPARGAARTLAGASSTAKNDALQRAADGLRRAQARLLEANEKIGIPSEILVCHKQPIVTADIRVPIVQLEWNFRHRDDQPPDRRQPTCPGKQIEQLRPVQKVRNSCL